MKRFILLTIAGFFWVGSAGLGGPIDASRVSAQDRALFVSDASYIVGTYEPAESDYLPATRVARAVALLESLDEAGREKISHAIDSAERRKWTNLPARPNAGGVRMGDMNEAQVKAVCDLLATLLSDSGYQKMTNIMLADDQLLRNGRARPGFGTENFSVVIFGTPSEVEPWAVQLDGHHVGLNVSLNGEELTISPSFIGTQPAEYELDGEQIRPLAGESDDAYALVNLLDNPQRIAAVVGQRRGDLEAGPGRDGRIPKAVGVACSTFNEAQRAKLIELISHWVSDLPPAHAEQRMAELTEEIDQMKFSWNGAVEAGSDISYRLQGPTVIIEFACQSLGGIPQQHLHTMYRNPTNEYSGQLK